MLLKLNKAQDNGVDEFVNAVNLEHFRPEIGNFNHIYSYLLISFKSNDYKDHEEIVKFTETILESQDKLVGDIR